MTAICPTVTAYDIDEFARQLERLTPFAARIHVDLMDGQLAPTVSPPLREIALPGEHVYDIHLMYQRPMDHLPELIALRPSLVVVHSEAELDYVQFANELHKEGIKVGLALLQDTPVEQVHQTMHSFDHILIFSGNLGHHGGHADMNLTEKVREVRTEYPEVEIGWDGGITADNAPQLVAAGVDVLNVGGYIQKADNPKNAYDTLEQRLR